jgi:hypothetical protein
MITSKEILEVLLDDGSVFGKALEELASDFTPKTPNRRGLTNLEVFRIAMIEAAHRDSCKHPSFELIFENTSGIGEDVSVRCKTCGEVHNITDVSVW